MRKFLLLVALFATTTLFAQSEVADSQYIYCELVGAQKFMSNKVNVSLDLGQNTKLLSYKNRAIVDEDNNVITFNSMIDAMNYMGRNGWDFVQAYTITIQATTVYHWVLRRNISSLSEEERAAISEEVQLME